MEEDSKDLLICRVCLGCFQYKECTSLFRLQNGRAVSDLIISIAKVEIGKGDGLPDHICNNCFNDLQNALTFKQKCEYSYLALTNGSLNSALKSPVVLKVKEELPIHYNSDDSSSDEKDFEFGNDSDAKEPHADTKDLKIEGEPVKKSKTIDLKLECHDCGEIFRTKCKLRVHWKKVHEKSYMKCERCKRQFKSFKACHAHKKRPPASCTASSYMRIEGEGRNRVFYCKDCDYKTTRVKDLITHYLLHSGHRPYSCSTCSKTFTQLSSLWTHQENAHQMYRVEGTCHICGKHFKGRSRFYKHLRGHNQTTQQCGICKKTFKTKQILNVHMTRHSGVKSLSCEICGTRFFTVSELCNHKRNTHFRNQKIYKCDLCEYVANRNETIKKHRARHNGVNIPCMHCGTFLDNEDAFLLHVKRHLDKKFACTMCDKRFHRKRYLNLHLRTKHCLEPPETKSSTVKVKEEVPVIVQYEEIISVSPTVG